MAMGTGCESRFPVLDGRVMAISRSEAPLTAADPRYPTTLQIQWLGTACHLIQLGDAVIFTDPYFTHFSLLRVAFGTLASDPQLVSRKTQDLPKPQAIFVGHSHYDHILDLPESMRQRNWFDVPVLGSTTTQNVLLSYGTDIGASFRSVVADETAQQVPGAGFTYRAYDSEHAPHIDGILLYPGRLEHPRSAPPTRATHFPVGDVYTFLFELTGGDVNQPARFTVFFAGAASTPPRGLPTTSVAPVDVAILCVPGWRNVQGYPAEFIRQLRPRYILLTHFDDFFEESETESEVVLTADLEGFIDEAQRAAYYPEFEAILVPAVDAVMLFADY